MNRRVTIVDYGLCNIFNVARALEVVGADVRVSQSPTEITNSERLLLPGVGAMNQAMLKMRSCGLIEAVKEFVRTERPFLGICLGMQMMFDSSEEGGMEKALGLIPGVVISIPHFRANGQRLRVPHIGWNTLRHEKESEWQGTPLENLRDGEFAYFAHSFVARPEDEKYVIATTSYGDYSLTAAVRKNSLFGFQFHPERSGEVGLKILKKFIET